MHFPEKPSLVFDPSTMNLHPHDQTHSFFGIDAQGNLTMILGAHQTVSRDKKMEALKTQGNRMISSTVQKGRHCFGRYFPHKKTVKASEIDLLDTPTARP